MYGILKATAGVYVFYFLCGIILERISKTPYGPEKERFTYTPFLMFLQCSFHVLAAVLLLPFDTSSKPSWSMFRRFAKPSFCVFGGMLSSTWALNYCSYPTQVVAKSSKALPVMVAKAVLVGHRYSHRKYVCITLISAGIAIFTLAKPSKHGPGSHEEITQPLGIALLLLSLCFDGIGGAIQDQAGSATKPSAVTSMLMNNAWSAVYSFAALLVAGQLPDALSFLHRHPQVFLDILLYSLCSTCGQLFIHHIVVQHSSLACAVITTSRKFFSVLLSVVYFGHSLLPIQWIAAVVVFIAIGVSESEPKHKHKHSDHHHVQQPATASVSKESQAPRQSADRTKHEKLN
jgi:UDP-galactose transporter B1